MRRKDFGGGGHRDRMRTLKHMQSEETTAKYFVPSFSIRRHVSRNSEVQLRRMQRDVQRRLGGAFTVMAPEFLTVKVLEQKKWIERMRELDIRPSPDDMKDLAYEVRDGLTEILDFSPSPLSLPIGRLGVYGYREQALGLGIQGWKGYRARYASHDENGAMTAYGAIVAENQFCLESIEAAVGDDAFSVEGLAPTPHITIARRSDSIRARELRNIESRLEDIIPASIEVSDPIIELRTHPAGPSEMIYVRHSWESLAAN